MSNHRTVILLGAGASFGSEFSLPHMATVLDWSVLKDDAYRSLRKALELFAGRSGEIDLEDFLTHLDLTVSTFLERWNRTRVAEFARVAESARRQLGNYLAFRLSHDEKPSKLHVELFRRLGSAATILTINYDRIADCSLMEVDGIDVRGLAVPTSRLGLSYQLLRGAPATVTSMQRESGLFLKLHGSVSWFCCPRHECINHQEIIERYNQPHGWRPRAGSLCGSCGAQLGRVIVAPTLSKQFVDNPRLELMWHLAHKRLSEAEELIVLGVSLPSSDYRLRWLLASTQYMRTAARQRRELMIINPDAEATRRIEAVCRTTAAATYPDISALLREWRTEPRTPTVA